MCLRSTDADQRSGLRHSEASIDRSRHVRYSPEVCKRGRWGSLRRASPATNREPNALGLGPGLLVCSKLARDISRILFLLAVGVSEDAAYGSFADIFDFRAGVCCLVWDRVESDIASPASGVVQVRHISCLLEKPRARCFSVSTHHSGVG